MRSKISAIKKFFAYITLTALLSLSLFIVISSFAVPKRIRNIVGRRYDGFATDSRLIYAVMKVESGFNGRAVSTKGACGLMQLLPSTFEYVTEKTNLLNGDIFDEETNVCAGWRYIDRLSKEFHGTRETLAAYNAGEGTVRGWLKDERYSKDGKTLDVIPYEETENYVKKVTFYYNLYKVIYDESGCAKGKKDDA